MLGRTGGERDLGDKADEGVLLYIFIEGAEDNVSQNYKKKATFT